MIKKELMQTLPLNACGPGMAVFQGVELDDEVTHLFWEYIDFCLAMDFPSVEFLRKNSELANKQHIYTDEKRDFDNLRRASFLGKSECCLNFDKYATCRLYVKHESRVRVKVRDNAFVMIDALDSAHVEVELEGSNARALVYLYGNASANGATQIVNKNMKTYKLTR